MTSVEEIERPRWASVHWEAALNHALAQASCLGNLGVHKQIAARLLEPFMYVTAIISSTDAGLQNFFDQRCHPDAQDELHHLANLMRDAYEASTPREQGIHIPQFGKPDSNGESLEDQIIRAVARCARISYGRELEDRPIEEDRRLVKRLIKDKHYSPLEHVAFWGYLVPHLGNFQQPWQQLRHKAVFLMPDLAVEIERK